MGRSWGALGLQAVDLDASFEDRLYASTASRKGEY